MGIFLFVYLFFFELFTSFKKQALSSLLISYKLFSHEDLTNISAINFFKKKNGFKLFFKKASARAGFFYEKNFFFSIQLLLAFFNASSFFNLISLRIPKKLKLNYFLLLILNVLLIAESAASVTASATFLNLNKFADFLFFRKLLLAPFNKKVSFRGFATLAESAAKFTLRTPVQNASNLKKFNFIVKSATLPTVESRDVPSYLFLINSFFAKNYKFFFLRNNEIYNKSRYSRNRQTYRTGVFWCIWLTVLTVIGLYFYFYVFLIKFTYLWLFFFFFVLSFFFTYFRSKIERHWFF